jgi:catechol 2,3-dioxygenase-like lactoylglutathione lyase family enzyme
VALRTHDLTASIDYAVDVLGLRLVENDGRKAYLAATDSHHELVYTQDEADGVDHFGVIASTPDELAAIAEKVAREGWPVFSTVPIETEIESGFAFVGPEGYAWHVYLANRKFDARVGGFGPDRYGHINFRVRNSIAMRDFLVRVFDMRVSDQIGTDAGFFMRCNADHHGIAVIKGEPKLHHHAWQTQSVVDLGRVGDRLAAKKERLIWGPVRHGAGHNIAVYMAEPSGGVIEVYTDMELINDKERAPICWDADDAWWFNQWDGYRPARMDQFGHPIFPREAALPLLGR